ncbi:MAG: 4Fe-4S binding protein [Candidatus Hodarchaeales archaeon]|jgi:DNA-directed RNA polymerase subunit D
MRWETIPPQISINQDLCIRCLKCVQSCPAEILILEKTNNKTQKGIIRVLDPSLCFECRACEVVCPESAIRVMCVVAMISAP